MGIPELPASVFLPLPPSTEIDTHGQTTMIALLNKVVSYFVENVKTLFASKPERSMEDAIQAREKKVAEVLASPSHTIQRAFFAHFGDDTSLKRAYEVAKEVVKDTDFPNVPDMKNRLYDHRLFLDYEETFKGVNLSPENKAIVQESIAFQKQQRMLDRVLGFSSPYIHFARTLQELRAFQKSDLSPAEKEKIASQIEQLQSSEEIFKLMDVIIYEKSPKILQQLKEKLVETLSAKIENLKSGESCLIPGGYLDSAPYGCLNDIDGHAMLNQCSKNKNGSIDWVVYNTGEGSGFDFHFRDKTPDGRYLPGIIPNEYDTGDVLRDADKRKAFLHALVGFLNPSKAELVERKRILGDKTNFATINQIYWFFHEQFKRRHPTEYHQSLKPYHIQGALSRCAYSALQVFISQNFKDDRALYHKFKNFNSHTLVEDLRQIVSSESKGINYEHPLARYGMTHFSFFGLLGAIVSFFAGEEVLLTLTNEKLHTILTHAEKKLEEREEKLHLLLKLVKTKEAALLEVHAIAQKDLTTQKTKAPVVDLKEWRVSKIAVKAG